MAEKIKVNLDHSVESVEFREGYTGDGKPLQVIKDSNGNSIFATPYQFYETDNPEDGIYAYHNNGSGQGGVALTRMITGGSSGGESSGTKFVLSYYDPGYNYYYDDYVYLPYHSDDYEEATQDMNGAEMVILNCKLEYYLDLLNIPSETEDLILVDKNSSPYIQFTSDLISTAWYKQDEDWGFSPDDPNYGTYCFCNIPVYFEESLNDTIVVDLAVYPRGYTPSNISSLESVAKLNIRKVDPVSVCRNYIADVAFCSGLFYTDDRSNSPVSLNASVEDIESELRYLERNFTSSGNATSLVDESSMLTSVNQRFDIIDPFPDVGDKSYTAPLYQDSSYFYVIKLRDTSPGTGFGTYNWLEDISGLATGIDFLRYTDYTGVEIETQIENGGNMLGVNSRREYIYPEMYQDIPTISKYEEMVNNEIEAGLPVDRRSTYGFPIFLEAFNNNDELNALNIILIPIYFPVNSDYDNYSETLTITIRIRGDEVFKNTSTFNVFGPRYAD